MHNDLLSFALQSEAWWNVCFWHSFNVFVLMRTLRHERMRSHTLTYTLTYTQTHRHTHTDTQTHTHTQPPSRTHTQKNMYVVTISWHWINAKQQDIGTSCLSLLLGILISHTWEMDKLDHCHTHTHTHTDMHAHTPFLWMWRELIKTALSCPIHIHCRCTERRDIDV